MWSVARQEAYELLDTLLRRQGLYLTPDMARREGGKPWFPDRPDLHFNLSHSGPWSLCALAEHEVGCDIELVRPRKENFPAYVLDRRELGWFLARGERWEDFYTLWTLKEARVKCTGQGLRLRPRDIPVPLLEPGESVTREGYAFTALAGQGWRGAVCEELQPPKPPKRGLFGR